MRAQIRLLQKRDGGEKLKASQAKSIEDYEANVIKCRELYDLYRTLEAKFPEVSRGTIGAVARFRPPARDF